MVDKVYTNGDIRVFQPHTESPHKTKYTGNPAD